MKTFIVLQCVFIPLCWSRLNEEANLATANESRGALCFHRPQEDCPPITNSCRCKKLSNSSAICCNVDRDTLEKNITCGNLKLSEIKKLHIRNATFDVLNITSATWRQFLSLSITDGYIGEVVGEFRKLTKIKCLNFSSNSINKFADRSLVNLFNLSVLDLSHNNISMIPRFKKDGMITLDVSGNEQLLCDPLFEALKRTELHFLNEDETSCLSRRTFHWFNTTELFTLKQVISVHELRQECSYNCTCEPYRLDIVPGKPPTFSVLVNCSGLQLLSLPPVLPPNTIALNISNNNISSLDAMNDEPSYQHLRELYADNNEITSILPLEGTNFFTNFVALSLRNNKLKSLPTYILSNVFDRNYNFQHVNLGQNRLQCDCNTAKVLKEWLLAKQKHIPDFEEIYCDNLNGRVLDLDPSKLCQSKQDWTDYIYYIIIAEVLLLVFLVTKVSYDYWVFKTAGYLPWPASQMPKLPCDWLCE